MNAFAAFRSPVLLLALLCVLPGVALGSDVEASTSEGAGSTFQRRIERAEHLYESLEYEKALNWLAQAKQVASTIEEQVKVALYRGIVLADLGRRKQALEAFRAALSLHPESALPLQVAPKVQRDFESVRKQVLRKLGSSAKPSQLAEAEKPSEEVLTAPAPLAEKPADPAPAAPPPETASSSTKSQLMNLRSRLGIAGGEVGKNVGSALGSALDAVVGTNAKPARPAPEAKPTAKEEATAKDEP